MYRVKDVWRTLQGEGLHAGRPAVFVRLVGCNMWSGYDEDRERHARLNEAACPLWCDTDFTKEGSTQHDANSLAERVADVSDGIRFVVLTGGEPFLQADAQLIRALHRHGFYVACETNGTRSLSAFKVDWAAHRPALPPDWITCSPKLPDEVLSLEWCDEVKLVVPDYHPDQYPRLVQRCRVHDVAGGEHRHLWLQPEDGPRYDDAVRLACATALARPRWRVSIQQHKVLGVQ